MDPVLIDDIERISASAASLRVLDVVADASRLEDWFRQLLVTESASSNIATLYFGLAEMRPAGTQDRLWTLYACGFVAGREPGPAPEWWPAGRYADSVVLRAVSEILPFWSDDDRLDAEYALVLGYSLLVGRSLAKAGGIPRVETFVGFDEGELFSVC